MTKIFEELSIIEDSIDEEDRVVHLLTGLPDSYNMLITDLEASQDVPKWALVTEHLLFEETKIKERDSGSGTELKAMTLKQVKRGHKCYHCGRNGHIKWDCKILHEDTKENFKKYSKKKAFSKKNAKQVQWF